MDNPRVVRRLAAILAADAVGYSRLMGKDEEATLAALTGHLSEVIHPAVEQHRGRLVKTTGDGFLAEFGSVVDSLRCAVAIQESIAARNEAIPVDRRVVFRIGINLGDVIVQDGDVFGDGVNVAARLEGLAEPGGICMSEDAYRQVRGKLDLGFKDLGPQKVKNIADTLHAYQVIIGTPSGVSAQTQDRTVAGFGDRPAIAVLPFNNMSQDSEQEYFADGITEDIITGLSLWRWLPVIARNTTATYKGRSVDVKQVGRELGVRYVLEGSVRKGGNRVRITAQLIDASTGAHVWAERYDRSFDDIFALQDEITERIVSVIAPEITRFEGQRVVNTPPADLGAWDLLHRGLWHVSRYTEDDSRQGRALLEQACERDPTWALPNSWLALNHIAAALLGLEADAAQALSKGVVLAEKAAGLDRHDALCRAALSVAYFWVNLARSIAEGEKAIELNPSLAMGHFGLGTSRGYTGRWQEALGPLQTARRLSPRDPLVTFVMGMEAIAHTMLRDYDSAIEIARKAIQEQPTNVRARHRLAVALAQKGDLDTARKAFEESKKFIPNPTVAFFNATYPFDRPEDREFFFDGLRKAGWEG